MVGKEPPDNWICSLNPDSKFNKCQCPETFPQIPVGEFQKEAKTNEQKKADLQDKMEKMQKELEKVSVGLNLPQSLNIIISLTSFCFLLISIPSRLTTAKFGAETGCC